MRKFITAAVCALSVAGVAAPAMAVPEKVGEAELRFRLAPSDIVMKVVPLGVMAKLELVFGRIGLGKVDLGGVHRRDGFEKLLPRPDFREIITGCINAQREHLNDDREVSEVIIKLNRGWIICLNGVDRDFESVEYYE